MENLNNVSEFGTALPEVAAAKAGGIEAAGASPRPTGVEKPHKERWKTGWHHPAAVYAKQVTQGRYRRSCCKWELMHCQRHLNDLKRQGTKDFPY